MAYSQHKMTGVALITGAASGISRATAFILVREGCRRLILCDLDLKGLQLVSEELRKLDESVQTCIVKTNIADEDAVQHMVDEGVKAFGAIHYAINGAGITSKARVRTHELETSDWDPVIAVNQRGLWLCQRAELRQMMKQEPSLQMTTGAPPQRGAIVNVASLSAVIVHATAGAYTPSKAGVVGITRLDAVAYAKDGIRVNAVLPGYIRTPMVEESLRRGAAYDAIIPTIPIQRWGYAEEIAEAIVFLASEKASLITGADLVVDGGKLCAA